MEPECPLWDVDSWSGEDGPVHLMVHLSTWSSRSWSPHLSKSSPSLESRVSSRTSTMSKGRPGSAPSLNISWNRGRSPVGGRCMDTARLLGVGHAWVASPSFRYAVHSPNVAAPAYSCLSGLRPRGSLHIAFSGPVLLNPIKGSLMPERPRWSWLPGMPSVLPRAKPGLGGPGVPRPRPWARPGLGLLRGERVPDLAVPGTGVMEVGGVSIAPARRVFPGHA